MHHRFFIAEPNSPIIIKLRELIKQRVAAGKVIRKFLKEFGITEMYGNSPDSYKFDFKSSKDADPELWSKTKPRRGVYYFTPKRSTPAGKELLARVKALPKYPALENALAEVPHLDYNFPVVIEGSTGYRPFIRYWNSDSEILVLSVPWQDVPKKELDAYIKQAKSKNRTSYSARLDYAQWTPPAWLREVKEWEALQLIDADTTATKAAKEKS